MQQQPLVLMPAVGSFWLDFQANPARSAPDSLGALQERWLRARALGAHHEGVRPEEHLTRGAPLRHRIERAEPVLSTGAAALEQAQAHLSARDFLLVLSDCDGVVVKAVGGGGFAGEASRVRLIEGACWSEATRGTNAIGTAISEGRPVFVHGAAHYGRRYHGLVCYAAPIHDADGTVLGAIDATSFVHRADSAAATGVVAAAQSIEQALRGRAYASAGAAVARALSRALDRMGTPALLVEPPGLLARLNAPARVALGGVSAGESAAQALGYDWDALVAEARAPTPGGLDVAARGGGRGARSFRLRVDPVETAGGRVIALLVFLEPASGSSPRIALRATPPREAPDPFQAIFARDEATQTALVWARRVAASEIPVMLLAETGAGKELAARSIHAASKRAAGPLVAVNCGAIAPGLLESELFGHGPGAFTGAERQGRHGLLQAADGGTLFLDEVAEMPLSMQAALLRVLENGTYHRVGETRPLRADVRLVCATCRDLPALVESGAFRKDLYFRLKGATVTLPPLRARTDIVALARHLLSELAARAEVVPAPQLTPEVEAFLARCPWPGNVRELKSTLDVALVLAQGSDIIALEHLPPDLLGAAPTPTPPEQAPLTEVEGWALRRVLGEVAGNVSLAARRLGVARSTLYRMMRRHGLGGPGEG